MVCRHQTMRVCLMSWPSTTTVTASISPTWAVRSALLPFPCKSAVDNGTRDVTPYNTFNDTEPLVDSSKDATTDEIHELLDRSDTATLVERHRFPPHTPVPATVVFSRKAFPLSLPKLDKYLSNLPMPSFSQRRHGIIEMFLPMQKLADSGRTIDDFEANSKVAPAWRNRKTILGSAVNIILGFTVR